MPDYQTPPATTISPTSDEAYSRVIAQPLSILCGRNNSGKSFLMRQLVRDHGDKASYLGPARYHNFNVLAPFGPSTNRKEEKWRQLLQHIQNASQNVDNSPLNLQQAIAELTDTQRIKLFEVIDELLAAKTELRHTVPDNSMSQMYVSVDGHNLSFTSSGFRLVATLLTSLLDRDYTHFLIDEPELGLSPEVQGVFADWLLNPEKRERYLDHVECVVLATHSPIFLDRKRISNNYWIDRRDNEIVIETLGSLSDLNQLQFSLLGNRFETLFLPSAIVLVEGKTDHAYLARLIALLYPRSSVSVIRSSGDGRIREILAIAKQMLGDIQRSPYANRLLVVIDKVHGAGLTAHLLEQGVAAEHVIVWDSNGIEFLYPRALLEQRFGAFGELSLDGDVVTANGQSIRKAELSDFVVTRLRGDEDLPPELQAKLLEPLRSILY
jgi:hypothetical protein